MKRLLLTRHAEAANKPGGDDFNRPLTDCGLLQAEELGERLCGEHLQPELWVASTALRAETTAIKLTEALGLNNLSKESSIYEASEQTLLKLINGLSDQYVFVALTGHNPGLSYLYYSLCNEIRDVPPCTALLIEFDIDHWAHVSAGTGTLKWYAVPSI